jgi:phytoene dehydrogenase-like protein
MLHDAIIIGGGHNGLVTAAYLGKAGLKVLVLERRAEVGGGLATEEAHPGFRYASCAHSCGLIHPQVRRDLELGKRGADLVPLNPVLFAPSTDGKGLALWNDRRRTREEIERFSKVDAEKFPAFISTLGKLSKLLRELSKMTPPDLEGVGGAELVDLLKFAFRFRRLGKKEMFRALRTLPASVADFLNEWFETDLLKGAIAGGGILGTFMGPRAQGTSLVLLYNQPAAGSIRPAAWPRGGMGNLARALGQAATGYGAEIRTNAEVAKILVKNEEAHGVVLKNGDELETRVVISGADIKTTMLRLLDPVRLDPDYLLKLRNFRARGGCAKVNLALAELPNFRAIPGTGPQPQHQGLIHIGPGLDALERAYDDAKYGAFSKKPFLEILIPSTLDPSLAPAGRHVMSVLMQYAPRRLRDRDWKDAGKELGQVVLDTINDYAPGFKGSVLHMQVLTPADLEETYGFVGGNYHHGELSLDQFFFMRPFAGWARYRTPVKNLYLCGAGTHPGGGITGLPGCNAAREILKDWKKRK